MSATLSDKGHPKELSDQALDSEMRKSGAGPIYSTLSLRSPSHVISIVWEVG